MVDIDIDWNGPCIVIGGAGWMGSFLTYQLSSLTEQFIHVVDVVLPRKELEFLHQRSNVKYHRCDITDAQQVDALIREIDPVFVFHLASIIDLRIRPSPLLHQVNVVGTENIISAMKALESCRIRFLVYTSSIDVASKQNGVENGEESDPYPDDVTNHYELSKIAGERLVLEMQGCDHIRAISLRPGHVFGPFDPIFHTVSQVPIAVGPRTAKMSMVFVGNAAYSNILAIEAMQKEIQSKTTINKDDLVIGQAFFIKDVDYNFCDFYWMLARRNPASIRIPMLVLQVLVFFVEIIQLYFYWLVPRDCFHPMTGLSSETLKPCMSLTISNQRATRILKYKATPQSSSVNFEESRGAVCRVISYDEAVSLTQHWSSARNK